MSNYDRALFTFAIGDNSTGIVTTVLHCHSLGGDANKKNTAKVRNFELYILINLQHLSVISNDTVCLSLPSPFSMYSLSHSPVRLDVLISPDPPSTYHTN